MELPDPIDGRAAVLELHVDGSTAPNPGPSGWGAVLTGRVHEARKTSGKARKTDVNEEFSGRLGDTTNNVAEYLAVVEGLRATHAFVRARGLSARAVAVRVVGDSQLLVRQLSGTYNVKSQRLRPLLQIVRGLHARFAAVEHACVPRERNTRADKLANKARLAAQDADEKGLYRPALTGLVVAWANGEQTCASQDAGAGGGSPFVLADAKFVGTLPMRKRMPLLRQLSEERPFKQIVSTGGELLVLGSIELDLKVRWPSCPDIIKNKVRVLVVHDFPVPLHISTSADDEAFMPMVIHIASIKKMPFEKDSVPVKYQLHKYWK